uniref:Uncharacterized protein n=1 Tax=Haemonchus contortus TaxID=6289 RepID=A0A7I4YWI2_HAECO
MKASCSSRPTKGTTTGDQDYDFKDYTAIAGMPENPSMNDLLQKMATVQLHCKTVYSTGTWGESKIFTTSTYGSTVKRHLRGQLSRDGRSEENTLARVCARLYESHPLCLLHPARGIERLGLDGHCQNAEHAIEQLEKRFSPPFRMSLDELLSNEDINNIVNLLKARAREANFKDIRKDRSNAWRWCTPSRPRSWLTTSIPSQAAQIREDYRR